MVAVASPHAQHEHDNEHGVQLKYQVGAHGPPQSPAAETVEKLLDVLFSAFAHCERTDTWYPCFSKWIRQTSVP